MKKIICLILLLTSLPICSHAGDNDIVILDWMHANGCLAALAADDYEAFCKIGTPELRNNVPKERFEAMVSELRPKLLLGYRLTDQGTMGAFPDGVVLWRLNFYHKPPAPSDDVLVSMANSHGKDISDFHILH